MNFLEDAQTFLHNDDAKWHVDVNLGILNIGADGNL
jgi:hypothetical protein